MDFESWPDDRQFEPLAETSFEIENLYERYDLQRMLRDRPNLLEEGLFVIAEEFGDWEESNRRIDLLALDGEGRLVVVELKRSDQDSLMDLQAIRYAAMVANMTLDQAIDAHRGYLRDRGMDGDADELIRTRLGQDEAETRISTANPRIILVSANFSKELTTSVLWLNQRDMDITCIKLQPYRSEDELYLEVSQVIPMPAAADYMVRLRNREREAEGQSSYQPVTSEGAERFQEAIKTARADQPEGAVGATVWSGGGVGVARAGKNLHKSRICQHGPSRRAARHEQRAHLCLQEQSRVRLPPVRWQPLRQSRPDIQEADGGNHKSRDHWADEYLLEVARRIPRSPPRRLPGGHRWALKRC